MYWRVLFHWFSWSYWAAILDGTSSKVARWYTVNHCYTSLGGWWTKLWVTLGWFKLQTHTNLMFSSRKTCVSIFPKWFPANPVHAGSTCNKRVTVRPRGRGASRTGDQVGWRSVRMDHRNERRGIRRNQETDAKNQHILLALWVPNGKHTYYVVDIHYIWLIVIDYIMFSWDPLRLAATTPRLSHVPAVGCTLMFFSSCSAQTETRGTMVHRYERKNKWCITWVQQTDVWIHVIPISTYLHTVIQNVYS